MGYFKQLLSHKFLFPFSLFCVLFSLLPLLFQFLRPFLMQYFFSYTIEKSYMFLLCNVLLAFIAICSGLINASSSSTQDESCMEDGVETSIRLDHNNVSESEIAASIATGENVMEVDQYPQEEEEEDEEKSLMKIYLEPENVLSDAKEDEEEEEEEEEGNAKALMIIDEDDETEELNKKCEDFIKKMKAGFCYEPRAYGNFYFDNQKSLVVVN